MVSNNLNYYLFIYFLLLETFPLEVLQARLTFKAPWVDEMSQSPKIEPELIGAIGPILGRFAFLENCLNRINAKVKKFKRSMGLFCLCASLIAEFSFFLLFQNKGKYESWRDAC